ncbi:hypothetical protein CPB84DRAFT_1812018 [Gymnopilus junonius]|uniref:Uncharacterized protein n=1 Tax=Gymnopilus junonius TaxID=109634 RepID=A0A9P5TVB1_GYMJU|nr:hypothetical protein CPB84DRAFT_1812018 [Gymnopilus junonius]
MPDSDAPYTTPDEDPFNVQAFVELVAPVRTIHHRRSSMLDKWISEQQAQSPVSPTDCSLSAPCFNPGSYASSSNPYLAYPDLLRISQETSRPNEAETASIISYDLVDDDDIPHDTLFGEPSQQVPVTPIPKRTHKSSRHSMTPSFRNLSFRSSPPTAGSSSNMEAASRALARLSFFPRTPRSSTSPSSEKAGPQKHNRSSSLSTLNSSTDFALYLLKWRPSVLGHFQQVSTSQISVGTSEAQYTPSRPSISSGETYTTWNTSHTTTTLDTNIPSTPSKLSLLTPYASRPSSPRTGGSMEGPKDVDQLKDTPRMRIPFKPILGSALDNIDNDDDLDPPRTYRFNKHESSRPSISQSSGGTLPRVKFSSLNSRTQRKKKKLIISGIGVTEARKFENLKRWCEITRMPNGDLQIDFRDPEVADTVCRVRAKVFIAGVGSVQLSWISGNKR